jgi:hypothetical protein
MRSRGNALPALLLATAAGVFTQAILAGLFLAGVAGARLAHIWVGFLLPYLGIVVAVVAVAQRSRWPRGVGVGAGVLPVLLWVQNALGHLPVPATTAVHVPFGVTLVLYPLGLALIALRERPRQAPPPTLPNQ